MNTERICPGCMHDNGGEKICPVCGYNSVTENNGEDALKVKTILKQRYFVGKKLSVNSEGITYLGFDAAEGAVVDIKEYFPAGMSLRAADGSVAIKKGKEFAFNESLLEFIELNRKFIGCQLPSVVPAEDVFEEKGTAYSVRKAFSGITLKAFLDRNGGKLKWEQARPLFLPLFDSLKGLHEMGVLHCAVSPETIYVGRDGKLRLTGICILKSRTPSGSIPAAIYSGYAAPEQYGIAGMHIGEFTDVYSLAATLFRVLIGSAPAPANERLSKDTVAIPAKAAEELPRQVLVALANGLKLNLEKRTVSIDKFKDEMVYGELSSNENKPEEKISSQKKETAKKSEGKKKNSALKYSLIAAGSTLLVALVVIGLVFTLKKKSDNNKNNDSSSQASLVTDFTSKVSSLPAVEEDTFAVPDFLGKTFAEASKIENTHVKIEIKGKAYSDEYEKGKICNQSVKSGTKVTENTVVELTISLGSKEFAVANVIGSTKENAVIDLLRQGFLYENIEIQEKYDVDQKPNVVIEQSVKAGTKVTAESEISIVVNTYDGKSDNSGQMDNITNVEW